MNPAQVQLLQGLAFVFKQTQLGFGKIFSGGLFRSGAHAHGNMTSGLLKSLSSENPSAFFRLATMDMPE